MGASVHNWRPKKKHVWDYREIPDNPETEDLYPGIDVRSMITEHTVEGNDNAVLGHCFFPPNSGHHKHRHTETPEIMYVIKGRLVAGVTTEEGDVETVLEPGTAIFVKKNQVTWCRNPFDETVEFIFSYYGEPSHEKSNEIDMRNE